MAAPPLGARLQWNLRLDAAAIKAGAQIVRNLNPLRHDQAIGPYTSGLLAGLVSTGFGSSNTCMGMLGSTITCGPAASPRLYTRRPSR